MAKSPRGHFWEAIRIRLVLQGASSIKYRKSPPAPPRAEFSDENLEYCIDIGMLLERHDTTGYMIEYFSGLRWDQIPEHKRGFVSRDIKNFRKALKDGGYEV
jgi:hypothetical protein